MSDGSNPTDAAAAFAERAEAEYGETIRHLVAFGSAVRGDDRDVHSEAELLLVLEDTEPERDLEALARETGLEHGTVLSVHVLPADRYEEQTDHEFVERAFAEGEVYV
ncbi:hypothetical protein C491_01057 [Natronococcus amylolyticus DSM 10524]|uniref:Nucleotidyltransferase n=1 Tax=Natronococcus amylolyticus DSM 10524 TaxID=1227497 RepID=L9XL65_9EURY|nr:hypothetical protein [Natronococcus amylolyticus]ELY61403.1 hypothetical protein C491_01057 [Natronococcus amylolyticus DSM 10524]